MAALDAEVMLPGHGLPVVGAERVKAALEDTATLLESICDQTFELMNRGLPLDEVLHAVEPPAELVGKPYLKPVYDEPEFIVRNLWRLYGGWYDGNPAHLKPAPEAELAAELAQLAGGADRLAERALELAGRRVAPAGGPPRRVRAAGRSGLRGRARRARAGERAARRGGHLDDGARDLQVGGDRCEEPVSALDVVALCGAAALLGASVWRLRQGRRRRALLALAGAVLLIVFAAGGGIGMPDGEKAVDSAADALDGWVYPFAVGMAFFETTIPPVTLIYPGEWGLMLCGAIAGAGRAEHRAAALDRLARVGAR